MTTDTAGQQADASPGRQESSIPRHYAATTADKQQFLMRNISSQDAHMVIAFDGRLDEQRLRRAVRLSVDAEPILGCRFMNHWWRPYWERRDDLDQVIECRTVAGDANSAALMEFMTNAIDPCRDPLVRALVLRDETDTLCVKVNHLPGDGTSFSRYIASIPQIYRELAVDPDYTPPIMLGKSRELDQISRHLNPGQKKFAYRQVIKNMRTRQSSWSLPQTNGDPNQRTYVLHKIPAERVQRLSKYGRKRLATLTMVLLAAMYQALLKLFPRTSEDLISIGTTVDLRHYLPRESRGDPTPFCNLSGPARFKLDPNRDREFDDVLSAIRQQEKTAFKKGVFGLESPALVTTFSILGLIPKLVPYAILQRRVRKTIARRREQGGQHAALVYVDLSDPEAFNFGDLSVTDVFATPTIYSALGFIVSATSYQGELTMGIGVAESLMKPETAREILDQIDQALPS